MGVILFPHFGQPRHRRQMTARCNCDLPEVDATETLLYCGDCCLPLWRTYRAYLQAAGNKEETGASRSITPPGTSKERIHQTPDTAYGSSSKVIVEHSTHKDTSNSASPNGSHNSNHGSQEDTGSRVVAPKNKPQITAEKKKAESPDLTNSASQAKARELGRTYLISEMKSEEDQRMTSFSKIISTQWQGTQDWQQQSASRPHLPRLPPLRSIDRQLGKLKRCKSPKSQQTTEKFIGLSTTSETAGKLISPSIWSHTTPLSTLPEESIATYYTPTKAKRS